MPTYEYEVKVTADTQAEADKVMIERLAWDEDYGFDYQLDWHG